MGKGQLIQVRAQSKSGNAADFKRRERDGMEGTRKGQRCFICPAHLPPPHEECQGAAAWQQYGQQCDEDDEPQSQATAAPASPAPGGRRWREGVAPGGKLADDAAGSHLSQGSMRERYSQNGE